MPLVPVDNALLEHLHMSRLQWVHGGTGVGSLPLLFCVKEAPEFIYINFDKFWDLNLVLIDSAAVEGGGGGAQGPPGIEGEEGDPGPPGPAGIDGAPGAVGPIGPPGLDGDEGDMGPPGPAGVDGLAGATGAAGAAGAIGPPGVEGEEGDPGLPIPGPAGVDGAPGAAGAIGPIGPPGIEGEEGDPGIAGPPGVAGVDGAPGIPGAPGADGAPGLMGPQGFEGEDGDPGLPGPAGIDGAAGAPGAAGADGASGPIGPPGTDGEDGAEVPIPYHPEVTLAENVEKSLLSRVGQELDLDTQDAEHFFAGPTSGVATAPTFRHIEAQDLDANWGDIVRKLMEEVRYHYYQLDIAGYWVETLVGAGAAVRYHVQHLYDISTSATANRSVCVASGIMGGWQMGEVRAQINWSKPILCSFLMTACEGGANSERRIMLGKDNTATIGDPTTYAVGLKFGTTGAAADYWVPVTGFVHDGVNPHTVALGNVHGYYTYHYIIDSKGDGNVDFYINGVLAGTRADGPTGTSANYFCELQMEAANKATAAHCILELHDARLIFDNG